MDLYVTQACKTDTYMHGGRGCAVLKSKCIHYTSAIQKLPKIDVTFKKIILATMGINSD